MTHKSKQIIGWILSGIAGLMLLASAFDKIFGSEHALQMASSFGILGKTYAILGVVEAISVSLFLVPKTGILGLLLLSSYLGVRLLPIYSMARTLFSRPFLRYLFGQRQYSDSRN